MHESVSSIIQARDIYRTRLIEPEFLQAERIRIRFIMNPVLFLNLRTHTVDLQTQSPNLATKNQILNHTKLNFNSKPPSLQENPQKPQSVKHSSHINPQKTKAKEKMLKNSRRHGIKTTLKRIKMTQQNKSKKSNH